MSAQQRINNCQKIINNIKNYSRKELITIAESVDPSINPSATTEGLRSKIVKALEYRILQLETLLPTDAGIISNLPKPNPIIKSGNVYRLDTKQISEGYFLNYIGYHPNTKFVYHVTDTSGKLQTFIPRKRNSSESKYSPKSANDFYHGVITASYAPEHVYIQLYPTGAKPQDFKLFTGDLNCVLSTILRVVPTKKAQICKYATANGFTDNSRPATKADVLDFARKFKVAIIIHSQTGIWYESHPGNKLHRKEIHIYATESHASTYIPVEKITQQVIQPAYDLALTRQGLHQPMKLSTTKQMVNGDITIDITAFRAGNTIYKSYKPPGNDGESPEFFHCTTELSYEYTKFYNRNNLRPLNEPYFSIFKACDHHLTTQQFQPFTSSAVYNSYDMVKAFPTFTLSPLYEQYKIFYGFVNLYENSDLSYISRPGASLIGAVNYTNEIVAKTQWIQPGCWYTHIRLGFILANNLATFEITHTVLATSEHIDFPFKPFDNEPSHKKFNNQFIGRLISGGIEGTAETDYICTDELEREQLMFELGAKPETVDVYPNQGFITHIYKTAPTQLYHIHAQIIDYQQCTFMSELVKIKLDNLIAIFTDEFFTKDYVDIAPTGKPHGFKHTAKHIRGDTKADATVHLIAPPTPVAPPLNIHAQRLAPFNATIGPAGCGKTYVSFEKHPRCNRIALAPSHKKKADFAALKCPVDTYHAFFGIGTKHYRQAIYEQVDIDEITQCTEEHLNRIKATCAKHRMNLSIFGDFDVIDGKYVKIYQRPPPRPAGLPISNSVLDFTITREIGPIRRQKCPKDIAFLDSLRDMSYEDQVTALRARCERVLSPPNNGDDFTGISMSHANCHKYNVAMKEYNEEHGIQWFRARCVKKRGYYFKGQVVDVPMASVWFGRTSADEKIPTVKSEDGKRDLPSYGFEPAVFVTADYIQGDTVDSKIYIDLHLAHMQNFLYVAVSRCVRLSDIVLIDPTYIPEGPLKHHHEAIFGFSPFTDNSAPSAPQKFAKAGDEMRGLITAGAFAVRSELPHNHFLVFPGLKSFYDYSITLPESERCFHEVMTGEVRTVYVDIDYPNTDRALWPDLMEKCLDRFIRVFRAYFKMNIYYHDILPIFSGGDCDSGPKFSLHIKTPEICAHIADQQAFATILRSHISGVDNCVYKSFQTMRILGSTKPGQNRNSKVVGQYSGANPLDLLYWSSASIIRDKYLDKYVLPRQERPVIRAAPTVTDYNLAPLVEKHKENFRLRSQSGDMILFDRIKPSYCDICNCIHHNDNTLFILRTEGGLRECCFHSKGRVGT